MQVRRIRLNGQIQTFAPDGEKIWILTKSGDIQEFHFKQQNCRFSSTSTSTQQQKIKKKSSSLPTKTTTKEWHQNHRFSSTP